MGGEPLRRAWVDRGALGADGWSAPNVWSLERGEVFAHGVVAVEDGGVSVGGDPVDDGVGEDFLFHPVVPLAGRQLGAVDR